MGSHSAKVCAEVREWMRKHAALHAKWLSELHARAELSLQEEQTAKFIADTLKTYCPGLQVEHGLFPHLPTAVIAVFEPRFSSGCILLRADIDALPIRPARRTTRLHEDVHHACGHDGHSACLLACAHYLSSKLHKDPNSSVRYSFKKVVLLWQPAEERGGGANILLRKCGLFRTLHCDVQEVYALHAWPSFAVGALMVGEGPCMAESGIFLVEITGTGGHAAIPSEHQADALLAAASLTLAGQSIVARGVQPQESAVVAFTKIESVDSLALNVVPKVVRVGGTIRTLKREVRESVCRQLQLLADGISSAYGCTAQVTFRKGYPVTRTTRKGFIVARAAAEGAVGSEHIYNIGHGENAVRPSMGAEDFGYMLEQRDGAYVWLGAGTDSPDLHTSEFVFPADMIPHGAAWFALLSYNVE